MATRQRVGMAPSVRCHALSSLLLACASAGTPCDGRHVHHEWPRHMCFCCTTTPATDIAARFAPPSALGQPLNFSQTPARLSHRRMAALLALPVASTHRAWQPGTRTPLPMASPGALLCSAQTNGIPNTRHPAPLPAGCQHCRPIVLGLWCRPGSRTLGRLASCRAHVSPPRCASGRHSPYKLPVSPQRAPLALVPLVSRRWVTYFVRNAARRRAAGEVASGNASSYR